MYRFVSDKINELKPRTWGQEDWFGFKDKADMMNSIKTNREDAGWALTELCQWGMDNDYSKEFEVAKLDNEYETPVYCIVDGDECNRYFTFEYNDTWFSKVIEMIPTTKIVETYMPIR
jgi:hypothetical protein